MWVTQVNERGGLKMKDGSMRKIELIEYDDRTHPGVDLVEVAPDYDHSQSTAILAAQVLLNFLGFIFHARSTRQDE